MSEFRPSIKSCADCQSCQRSEEPIDGIDSWTKILITSCRRELREGHHKNSLERFTNRYPRVFSANPEKLMRCQEKNILLGYSEIAPSCTSSRSSSVKSSVLSRRSTVPNHVIVQLGFHRFITYSNAFCMLSLLRSVSPISSSAHYLIRVFLRHSFVGFRFEFPVPSHQTEPLLVVSVFAVYSQFFAQ